MSVQVVIGFFAHSQALIADGVHSLADLISDFVVLIANRASAEHPTPTTTTGTADMKRSLHYFWADCSIAVGVGMFGARATHWRIFDDIPPVHSSALFVALLVLVSKEALFRYMLRAAQRVRSAMLIANAWHARSDAASSLVVALGIIGKHGRASGARPNRGRHRRLHGCAKWAGVFGWDALQDLSDRALDEATADGLARAAVERRPACATYMNCARGKWATSRIVDAHILVDPLISVSEGHYIAESARSRVLNDKRVLDALIHVDPGKRRGFSSACARCRRARRQRRRRRGVDAVRALHATALNLHYLSTGLDVDVLGCRSARQTASTIAELTGRIDLARAQARS